MLPQLDAESASRVLLWLLPMNTPIEQSALLGALQGLTEFLPVSSSGHLALAQTLFGVKGAGLTLSVVLHAGTLLATVVYFRKRLLAIVSDWFHATRQGHFPRYNSPGRDAWLVVLATLPTAVFGLLMHDTVESWTQDPMATGAGFLVTAGILVSTHWARGGTLRAPGVRGAVLIGVMQGLAIFPGVSRSGMTIIAALWLGVRSERAFEFSMLLSIPAVLGAVVLELAGANNLDGKLMGLVLGASVAFCVGLGALALLRQVVSHGRLAWFALWVLPLGFATLALGQALPSPGAQPSTVLSHAVLPHAVTPNSP